MSTNAKFTPGPWSLPHFAEPDINCKCGYVLTDHLMGAVATVHCSGEGDDWQKHGDNPKFAEAVANARLIAAAPDLYASLYLAETVMMIVEPRSHKAEYLAALDKVRAALAKAGAALESVEERK